MNRTILSATDFSADARQAAERAAQLCASGAMAGNTLLHVIQASWLDTVRRLVKLPPEAEAGMLAEATAQLGRCASEIGARIGFVPQTGVRVGSVVDTLLREAEQHALLALGARGLHPLRDFALGTRPSTCCGARAGPCWWYAARWRAPTGGCWSRWISRRTRAPRSSGRSGSVRWPGSTRCTSSKCPSRG